MALNITPASILSDISLAGNLLGSTSKIDTIAIFGQASSVGSDNTLNIQNTQLFAAARPIKVEVRETARVMDYPVETGVMLSDHRISNPTEIVYTCILPQAAYASTYPAIRDAWTNATLLSVQTRTGVYANMIISDLPHEEDTDLFNAVTITIKLRQVIMIGANSVPSYFAPKNPTMQATISSGIIAASNIVGSGLSYFHAATVAGIRL